MKILEAQKGRIVRNEQSLVWKVQMNPKTTSKELVKELNEHHKKIQMKQKMENKSMKSIKEDKRWSISGDSIMLIWKMDWGPR